MSATDGIYRADGHLGRFALERLLTDDLSDDAKHAAEAHLEICAACTIGFDALRQDGDAFARQRPYSTFRVEHERRRDARRPAPAAWWPMVMVGGGSLAVAAALLLAVIPVGQAPEADTVRIKGSGVGLSFAVLQQGALRPGLVGETLGFGATMQLSYDAGRHTHMALIGVDGAGRVEVHFPADGTALAPLQAGQQGRLPFSLTLDATPGIEAFYAIYGSGPLSLQPIIDGVTTGTSGRGPPAQLNLPAEYEQAVIWIIKQ